MASPAEGATNLLGRMRLEEKAAQMTWAWHDKATTLIDSETSEFDSNKAREAFKGGNGIGQIGRPSNAGGTFRNREHLIATLKHVAAHGPPESGMNCAPANVPERELREVFLAPLPEALHEGAALSVMASHNEIDGVPSHASTWLLPDVLGDEWGFTGFVISDDYATWELHDRPDTHAHIVAADKKEAAALAVQAGVDIELPEPDGYRHLVELVEEGALSVADLDDLVRPMLEAKFRFGLSYTTFALESVRMEDAEVAADGSTRVLADVTNTGRRAGTEAVQLYIRDVVSPVTRSVKELNEFARVTLEPGETQTVEIPVTPKSLAFWRIGETYGVEPSDFELMAGSSSRDVDLRTIALHVTR